MPTDLRPTSILPPPSFPSGSALLESYVAAITGEAILDRDDDDREPFDDVGFATDVDDVLLWPVRPSARSDVPTFVP